MTPVEFMALFSEFRAPSWDAWRAILGRLTPAVREFWCVAGRGSGKSRMAALLAVCFAARTYARAPGERIYVGVFAPDRRQAALTLRYIVGLLESVPVLAQLIVAVTRDAIELSNGVVIEVITASFAAPRGRAYALVILEEAAFLPTEDSASPDTELVRAVRPALARVPGSLLAVVSSPFARRGELWRAAQRYAGQPDGDVVFVQAPTLTLNPGFDRRAIAAAYESDPVAAAREYDAQFSDLVGVLLSGDALARATRPDDVAPVKPADAEPVLVIDAAGGATVGGDGFGAAYGWAEIRAGRPSVVVAWCAEVRPIFAVSDVLADLAALAEEVGTTVLHGDQTAFPWLELELRALGLQYRPIGSVTSANYLQLLTLVTYFPHSTEPISRQGRGQSP